MAVEGVSPGGGRGERARFNYRRYWLSLYRRDVCAAERQVEAALRCWPPSRIYQRVFEPALYLSGTLWAKGAITYGDEHFITYHTQRLMRRVRRQSSPPGTPAPPEFLAPPSPLAVATTVGQNHHQIGLRMVCDFLGWDNWRVQWLSSNERAVVGEEVGRLRPDVVLLSVGLDSALTPTARLIAHLRRRQYQGLIVVGGRIINGEPDLAHRLGADLTAPNGAALVRLLRPRFPATGRRRPAEAGGEHAASDEVGSPEDEVTEPGPPAPAPPPTGPVERAGPA